MSSISIESVKALDKSSMLKLLLEFPRQILDAQRIGKECRFSVKARFNKIVFTGVGGSAIGADLIRSYAAGECRLPIVVNRDYTLPNFVDKDTLLVVSSYSGNTEETISAYKDGCKRKAGIIIITSDGELKKDGGKRFPCITIPEGYPPRCALGYSSIPLIVLFSKLGILKDKDEDIKETATLLTDLRDRILAPEAKEDKNTAKRIARSLFDKYVIIYGANQHMDCAVTRWRGQLAENSKTLSSSHLFPEMNHNEIVGWANPKRLMKDLAVLFLRDKTDHPRVKIRMEITKTIIEKEGAKVIEVNSRGESLLARIFSLIYIGDFVSFYLAIQNGVDPTPVDNVTYLKKELAKYTDTHG